jgi:hypothetical protein
MMTRWRSTLRVSPREVRLLVTDAMQGDVLKARLPGRPPHPRALLTLLEGLALWNGQTMCAVISAAGAAVPMPDSTLFGDELWPGESPLVRFEVAVPECRKRLPGLGDFRGLRLLAPQRVRA